MTINTKYNICILTTGSGSIRAFYLGQLEAMVESGIEPTVVCNDAQDLKKVVPKTVRLIDIPMSRSISPIKDLCAILKLYKLLRKNKYALIQYSTPKASLLSSIAAFLAKVPIRIYIMWGLYYMGQKGFKRVLLKSFEKIICSISTHILPISHEMVGFMEKEGLTKREKCEVMRNGSACGIDLEKYNPERWSKYRVKIRQENNIPEHATVIGTVSRLTGDKGINELVSAFDILNGEAQLLYLLLVGDQEQKDRLSLETEQVINNNDRVRKVGWQDNPCPYYSAMDIFCLPTYREGFGKVNLEAQAMGLPVISTNVIGPRESIENGVTGFLVEANNTKALIEPLKRLILDPNYRKLMGRKGRDRVKQKFNSKDVIRAVVEHRLKLLEMSYE